MQFIILIIFTLSIFSDDIFESVLKQNSDENNQKNCYYSNFDNDCSLNNLNSPSKIKEKIELEVIDSIDIQRDFLLGITYGNNFLWVLKAKYELEYDSVFKIDPSNKKIVESYRLPGNKSNWHQGIAYDSSLTNEHYLFAADDDASLNPYSKIYKIKIENIVVVDTIKLPIKFLNAMTLRNDSLWLISGGALNDSLFKYDLKNRELNLKYLVTKGTNGLSFGEDFYHNPILWSSIYKNEERGYLQSRDPYTEIVINNYKSPGPGPISICWENQTPGGPYLWVTDFETNMIYKIKAPLVTGFEENKNNNDGILNIELFPNPFSEKTKISFNLEKPSYSKITIYNSLGYKIDVLADEYLSEGRHEFTFDGSALASGTYYYVLQAGGRVETGKLVLIK